MQEVELSEFRRSKLVSIFQAYNLISFANYALSVNDYMKIVFGDN